MKHFTPAPVYSDPPPFHLLPKEERMEMEKKTTPGPARAFLVIIKNHKTGEIVRRFSSHFDNPIAALTVELANYEDALPPEERGEDYTVRVLSAP